MCLITLMDLLKMILFFIEFYPVVLKIISVIGFCIGRCLAKFGQLRDLSFQGESKIDGKNGDKKVRDHKARRIVTRGGTI